MESIGKNCKATALVKMSEQELLGAWDRLGAQIDGERAAGTDTAQTERVAGIVAQEMCQRGIDVPDGELFALAKSRSSLADRVAMLPGMIVLSEGEVQLALQADGELRLFGGFCHPDDRAAVSKALLDVGVQASHAVEQYGDDDQVEALYDLALVRSPAGKAPPVDAVSATLSGDNAGWRKTDDGDRGSGSFIACSSPAKQVIYYLVSEPGTVDAHGHRIAADTIEDALHGYVANSRKLKIEHGKDGELRHLAPQRGGSIDSRAVIVEGFIAPMDLSEFHGRKLDGPIKRGSSIVAIHYSDRKLWDALKAEDHGISWGGYAAKVDK